MKMEKMEQTGKTVQTLTPPNRKSFIPILQTSLKRIKAFFFLFFSSSWSSVGNSGSLTWLRHSSRKSSATHSYQCEQYFRVSRQWYGCQSLGSLTRAQVLMHAIEQRGCTDTVRESALEVDAVRKIPCRTGDSNLRQYCTWIFNRTLYQLSYSCRYGRLQKSLFW